MKLLVFLPRLLPMRAAVRVGGLLGIVAFDVVRIRRAVTLANLERALGDVLDRRARIRTGRRSYVNFAKSMVEFASLGRLGAGRVLDLVSFAGREHADDVLARGGAIVVTGHFGSWELLGAAAAAAGMPVEFLVGEQQNRMVDGLMNDLRRSAGIGIIPRGVAARGIFAALKRGHLVALLSDQEARRGAGVIVDFFGIPSSTYPGAAQFAYRAGKPILFCYIVRRPDETHEAVFLPPIEVDPSAERETEVLRLTAAHAAALEAAIRKHPDHWLWAHKRWKTSPPAGGLPAG
ncbi:MAG: lysophospholipid acyltransferase family protein [Candidatus Krumholzibacteriota bacterium]|nr:lysophospholipid acyltransferase family protein [Candidatus Krumholzibacteriota bacterium]